MLVSNRIHETHLNPYYISCTVHSLDNICSVILCIEMEIILDNQGTQSPNIVRGSKLELSCYSHLSDSSDIPITLQFVYANNTVTATCPTAVGTNKEFTATEILQKWKVYRNTTLPHNCILALYDFEDVDDGNYSCSTVISGREVQSNVLKLQTLKGLETADSPSSHESEILLGVSIAIVGLLILLILVFMLGRYIQYRRHRSKS